MSKRNEKEVVRKQALPLQILPLSQEIDRIVVIDQGVAHLQAQEVTGGDTV